jgi:hypothetical protein
MRFLSLTAIGDLEAARAVLIEIAQHDLGVMATLKWKSPGGVDETRVQNLALYVVACMIHVRAPSATKDEMREVIAVFEETTRALRVKSDRRQALSEKEARTEESNGEEKMSHWCSRCGRGTDDAHHSKYCGAGDDKDFSHDWSLTERPTVAGIGIGDVWVNPRGRRFTVLRRGSLGLQAGEEAPFPCFSL